MLILKMKSRITNMDIVRTLIILLGLSFVRVSSNSIGSEFESSLSCSKFHFEEKVLEKLVRLEHKMQILEEKMDVREKLNTVKMDEISSIMDAREKLNTVKLDEISNIMDAREKLNTDKMDEISNIIDAREKLNTDKLDEISNIMDTRRKLNIDKLDEISNIMDAREKLNTAKLEEMKNIKKQTETFVQSVQDAKIQDQTRFHKSFQETVEHFQIQATNETDICGDQMNALLESFSSKIEVFTEAENKRESVKKSMQLSFDREQKRFNSSFVQIVENFKESSHKKLQEIISNIQTVVVTGCYVGGGAVSAGSLKFPDIKTSIGISDLSTFKSTGKFTCQIPGYYFIAVTLMSYNNNMKIEIMRNSTAIHWQFMTGYTKEKSYWTPGAAAVSLELKSNDKVWIKLNSLQGIYQSCLTIFKIN